MFSRLKIFKPENDDKFCTNFISQLSSLQFRIKIINLYSILIFTLFSVVGFLVKPSMYSDSGAGFIVWDSMKSGAPFNFAVTPSISNIANDREAFLTWWSPGQYWFPGIFERIGLSLGNSIWATVSIFSALGLLGWRKLYRAFGFSEMTVCVTIAIIVSSRFFNIPFSIYNGGEVLIFSVFPWSIYLLLKISPLRWVHAPVIFFILSILFFMKLTGIMLGLSMLAAICLYPDRKLIGSEAFKDALIIGFASSIWLLIFYLNWLSNGWTPASGKLEHNVNLFQSIRYLSFELSALAFSSLSLRDLAAWILLHPGRKLMNSLSSFYAYIGPVALIMFSFLWINYRYEFSRYARFTFILALISSLALFVIYLRGGAIGMEERHLRQISLVILVGVVHFFLNSVTNYNVRILASSVAIISSLYGLSAYINRSQQALSYPIGVREFRHMIASSSALEFIRANDVDPKGGEKAIFVVTSPEIALEIRRNRVISNHADFESVKQLQGREYRGRVDKIFVLVQNKLVENGKANAILNSFVDYSRERWRSVPLEDFTAFVQG